MPNKGLKISIFILAIISFPVMLWATRGPHDYGIIMVVMLMIYTIPVGLALLGFIIYLIVKLKSNVKPGKKPGRIIFVLSLIILFFSVIIPLAWSYSADWHHTMIELMLGDFIPIVLLSATSAVLAMKVKRYSQTGDK